MSKFRKLPVVVEAVQLRRNNTDEMHAFAECGDMASGKPHPFKYPDGTVGLAIHTLNGTMNAKEGEWIIRGVNGELYPCADDIFRKTYESAD